jgi:hypothetical protein
LLLLGNLVGQGPQVFFGQEGIDERLDHVLVLIGQVLDFLKLFEQLLIVAQTKRARLDATGKPKLCERR